MTGQIPAASVQEYRVRGRSLPGAKSKGPPGRAQRGVSFPAWVTAITAPFCLSSYTSRSYSHWSGWVPNGPNSACMSQDYEPYRGAHRDTIYRYFNEFVVLKMPSPQ